MDFLFGYDWGDLDVGDLDAKLVMPGLVPGIHVLTDYQRKKVGRTSPAMTEKNRSTDSMA